MTGMYLDAATPFGFGRGEGFDKGSDETDWIVARERAKSDEVFREFNPSGGKISGNNISAVPFLLDSIYRKSGCATHGEVGSSA